ncbi:hypothetical protein HBI12_112640 [Parastagonospora nodorum]|nr:hypothetical protein HBI12_112640 [Parastagonospora nodorum]KAH5424840.1 hypothetical protein HBI47_123420 [Parastagonospora nodorum]
MSYEVLRAHESLTIPAGMGRTRRRGALCWTVSTSCRRSIEEALPYFFCETVPRPKAVNHGGFFLLLMS